MFVLFPVYIIERPGMSFTSRRGGPQASQTCCNNVEANRIRLVKHPFFSFCLNKFFLFIDRYFDKIPPFPCFLFVFIRRNSIYIV